MDIEIHENLSSFETEWSALLLLVAGGLLMGGW
jgi:hypothetical protein